ncbi:MAG: cytochrome c biogenesis protein CcsA [Coriobacteriales bacterium]|jgi:cytochrome c-type biogenesis protein CcmF|nr:cytochrome c biogenesis protein CcsA [Coriobacteriales bacterium]
MALLGATGLVVACAAALASIIFLFLAARETRVLSTQKQKKVAREQQGVGRMQGAGSLGVWLCTLVLTLCCLILVVAFLGGDNSIAYVAEHQSDSSSDLALLYKISGLWAGREGSLLFWAWLISLFNALLAFHAFRRASRIDAPPARASAGTATEAGAEAEEKTEEKENSVQSSASSPSPARARSHIRATALDCAALAVSQIILLAFIFILIFDESNRPFTATAAEYLDASGQLTGNAVLWGMNAQLEHWAMAIHPPTLFIGYAGMTVVFAYAMGALIVNDPSDAWVRRASRYTLVSWLFLGAGIGLGAVWAYVVLGWGGYWGWDAVENASLLSWIIGVALVHSMTIYRQRGSFKRWTVMLACLTFAFVIVGTFITRSGIVESVHAFAANQVSLVLFGLLIILPLLAGALGLFLRRRTFVDATDEADEAESLMSKDVAYYLNNVIMLVCTVFLAYMTLSSALPSWLPFGGQVLKATAFNGIARPIGVLYCLIIAVCPLLAWRKTSARSFFRQAWLPATAALLVFVLLCFYFVGTLLPISMQTMAQGGTAAQTLYESGPFWYYAALTLLGFLAASLLVFNSLVMLVRAVARRRLRVQTIGGFLAHMAIGVLLVGLIGSSMYVYERAGYMPYDEESDTAGETFVIRDYRLSYVSNAITPAENGDDVLYSVTFAVEKDGAYLGELSPSVQLVQSTSQQMLHAAVLSLPAEDLFVVYNGVNNEGAFSLDVRINPLIGCVWAGFGLLMVGTAIAAFGRRR